MISEMAQKLKEILANTSQEEFDREWSAIEKMGFKGPHADDIVEYFTAAQSITVSYEVQMDKNTLSLSNNSLFTAA